MMLENDHKNMLGEKAVNNIVIISAIFLNVHL